MASPFQKQVATLLANSPAFQKRAQSAIPGIKIAFTTLSGCGDTHENKGS
jgi:hypothetical protein